MLDYFPRRCESFPMLLIALAITLCPPGPRDNCVVDGDTFWTNGEKVRIADIDAPEIHGRCDYETKLAAASRDRLLTLLHQPFELQRQGKDRYGRTLANVSVNGRDIGMILVHEGLARVWDGARHPWC